MSAPPPTFTRLHLIIRSCLLGLVVGLFFGGASLLSEQGMIDGAVTVLVIGTIAAWTTYDDAVHSGKLRKVTRC